MRFSIIIPTHNRKETLRRSLSAAIVQDYLNYEVIVVDDGSSDGTGEMVRREFPHVRCIRQEPNRGPATARNQGIKVATGEITAFTDDDCLVPPMRECGHRQEWTESIRKSAVPLQGLWGLWGPGIPGAIHGGPEGTDSASLSGAGHPAGIASAVWGLHRDSPEMDSKKAAVLPPPVAETLRPAEEGDVREVDELCSWVGRKDRKVWTWTALCRHPRPVVACVVGDRREATGWKLGEAIPEADRGCRSYSDFWAASASVFPRLTHRSVDKKSGRLAPIEGWPHTVRQRLARYVRKTLAFSRSLAFHEAVTRMVCHGLQPGTPAISYKLITTS